MPRAILYRGLLLALLWWVLSEGRADSWALGAPAVLAALWVSLHLLPPPRRISAGGLLGYLAFFLGNSLRGGLQVSLLALRGRAALEPAILEWRLKLPEGLPRVLMLNTLGLMPGTVGVELDDARLRVHVIDRRLPIAAEVAALERHIARIFGACP